MRAEVDANRKPGEGFSGDEKQMIGSMVQRLKDRLASQPDDYNGWMQLGRSPTVMKDPAGAVDAYGKAAALKPTEVEPLFNLATSLIDVAEKTGQGPARPAVLCGGGQGRSSGSGQRRCAVSGWSGGGNSGRQDAGEVQMDPSAGNTGLKDGPSIRTCRVRSTACSNTAHSIGGG